MYLKVWEVNLRIPEIVLEKLKKMLLNSQQRNTQNPERTSGCRMYKITITTEEEGNSAGQEGA